MYYSLFGSKVPNCLAKNEQPLTSGLPKIPKIPKISDTKRADSPFDNNSEVATKQPIVEASTNAQEPVINRESDSVSKPPEIKEEPIESIQVIFIYMANTRIRDTEIQLLTTKTNFSL